MCSVFFLQIVRYWRNAVISHIIMSMLPLGMIRLSNDSYSFLFFDNSNSFKKTQRPVLLPKIDDKLEQYTQAIEVNYFLQYLKSHETL